ncbi:MAG: rhodanese-like domain-containing protein [Elusimicrobia bacterium]|nr:rhodanese-like domain-containing protein [Elusimicrobiota bacterium]
MDQVIIDVREKEEFAAEHVPGSVCLPMSHFNELAPGLLQCLKTKRLLLMCRSGRRAELAKDQLAQLGFGDIEAEVFAGGILEWRKLGRPVTAGRCAPLPILRQVQLVVGPCVLAASVLSLWLDPRFAWAAAFFGAGLTMAGATGWCPLAGLLAAMPWNKSRPGGTGRSCCS